MLCWILSTALRPAWITIVTRSLLVSAAVRVASCFRDTFSDTGIRFNTWYKYSKRCFSSGVYLSAILTRLNQTSTPISWRKHPLSGPLSWSIACVVPTIISGNLDVLFWIKVSTSSRKVLEMMDLGSVDQRILWKWKPFIGWSCCAVFSNAWTCRNKRRQGTFSEALWNKSLMLESVWDSKDPRISQQFTSTIWIPSFLVAEWTMLDFPQPGRQWVHKWNR